MPEDPIRCSDAGRWEEELSALIDGELAPAHEVEVRAHLDVCASCRARLAALRAVDERLKATTLPALPADLAARLQRRIEADAEPGERSRAPRTLPGRAAPPRRPRAFGALAAAVAAAAALALYLAIDPGAAPHAPPSEVPPRVARESGPATPDAEPVRIAEAPPTPTAPPEASAVAPDLADPVFDGEPVEDIALALELETVEDFDVIANLEILEALIALEEGTG